MNFWADEGVDRQMVERLRIEGHRVFYVAEMELGVSDESVLDTAANREMALLLTADVTAYLESSCASLRVVSFVKTTKDPKGHEFLLLRDASCSSWILWGRQLPADKDFGEMIFRRRVYTHGIVLVRLAGLSPDRKAGSCFSHSPTRGGTPERFHCDCAGDVSDSPVGWSNTLKKSDPGKE